ncbi:MAG: 50S ribosomal protein L15 [Candidatus Altiarchaeales archaeon]|nr:50S ribosomal protein L15 [Candidatus Altiarchaeales archaeon]
MSHGNRKVRKMRGSRTHGYGNTQKHRGAGSRGGRGMAGSKKHKWAYVSKYMPEHFGRSGFKRPQCQVKEKKIANIGDLNLNASKLLKEGFLKKEKDAYVVNLTEKGFDKLLGAGKVSNKFIITVKECSGKAKEKIEAAGGKLILPEGKPAEGQANETGETSEKV